MDRSEARRATILIMAVFILQPLAFGGWLAMIPFVKESLGLSKGELALALLGMPVALIPCLQFAGGLVTRFGLRRIMLVTFVLQSAAILLPLMAWSGPSLFFALACFGASAAFLEVGMNVYAGRLEKRAALMIMNRCHGFWALGLVFGSAFVSATVAISPWVALTPLVAVSLVGGLYASHALPRLISQDEGTSPPRRKLAHVPRPVFFIAAFMFFSTMTEGAMADWAAVYLAERLGGVDGTAGIAVTIFTAFLATGRFLGDWLKRLLGAVKLARATIFLAIIGVFCLVLPLPLAAAYVGFALIGAGVAVAYPLGVSAVAEIDDRFESANIAIMATVALCGFLVGPPIIGGIAEATSLPMGLAALIPGLVLALWFTRWLSSGPIPVEPESGQTAIPGTTSGDSA